MTASRSYWGFHAREAEGLWAFGQSKRQAVCCTGNGSHGDSGPHSGWGLSAGGGALPDLPLPQSSARGGDLDFVSSSSCDPCVASDPPFSSPDPGFPFYRLRLMNEGSLKALPPNLVIPQGGAWRGWGLCRHRPFSSVRVPSPLSSLLSYIHNGQSASRVSVSLKDSISGRPGKGLFWGAGALASISSLWGLVVIPRQTLSSASLNLPLDDNACPTPLLPAVLAC